MLSGVVPEPDAPEQTGGVGNDAAVRRQLQIRESRGVSAANVTCVEEEEVVEDVDCAKHSFSPASIANALARRIPDRCVKIHIGAEERMGQFEVTGCCLALLFVINVAGCLF